MSAVANSRQFSGGYTHSARLPVSRLQHTAIIPPAAAAAAPAPLPSEGAATSANSIGKGAVPRRSRPWRSQGAAASQPAFDCPAPRSALLDQLAQIQSSSNSLISSMQSTFKSRFDRSEMLLQLSTRYLLVGRCDSPFAGTARFLPTEVVYAFHHPQHRAVEMHMRYRDMVRVRVSTDNERVLASRGASSVAELRFRINAPLAYFAREYDPLDSTHELRIGFGADADLLQFNERVLPHILRLCQGAQRPEAATGGLGGESAPGGASRGSSRAGRGEARAAALELGRPGGAGCSSGSARPRDPGAACARAAMR